MDRRIILCRVHIKRMGASRVYGFTGLVFSQGVVGLWLVLGVFGGYLLTWLVMGPRLNAETAERGYITVVDFITSDVKLKWKRMIGIVCALMILFCFVFYISSQFQAAGNALTEIFDMSSTEAILLGAAHWEWRELAR